MLSFEHSTGQRSSLRHYLTATVVGLHEITDTPVSRDRSYVTPAQLSEFIRRATDQGYTFVDLDGAFEDWSVHSKHLLLTLDGGYLGNYQHSSILRFHRVPAVFFVDPETLGRRDGVYPQMTWEHVQTLARQPSFEIGLYCDPRRTEDDDRECLWEVYSAHGRAMAHRIGEGPRALASAVAQHPGIVRAVEMGLYDCGFGFSRPSRGRGVRGALPRTMLHQGNVGAG